MPQYTVPKFIEHQPKIVGPLTWRQFIYIGAAGAVCFVLYFTLPFIFFLLASSILMSLGTALALVRVGGRSLPIILKNFSAFFLRPKMYLWKKKKTLPPKLIERKTSVIEEPEEKTPVPTAIGKSRLKDLSTQVETKQE